MDMREGGKATEEVISESRAALLEVHFQSLPRTDI